MLINLPPELYKIFSKKKYNNVFFTLDCSSRGASRKGELIFPHPACEGFSLVSADRHTFSALVFSCEEFIRELLGQEASVGTVFDGAGSWVCWHMGQFGRDYKARFGELPSKTLKSKKT